MAARLLLALKAAAAADKLVRIQWESSSGEVAENITPAHVAYSLVTNKVWNAARLQCIHLLNGCVADEETMYICTGTANYRSTGMHVSTYKSMRGTSKTEVAHSVSAQASTM